MGKIDTQRGQRLTLRCSTCKRPLGGTNKIFIRCKCGEKTVFENQTSEITKQGWKRIK
ncbi:MAG: hypothetical protein P8Y18_06775 [Candidatus Bathyarchaeota archaeon]